MTSPFINNITVRFEPGEQFFGGKSASSLVPDVFPVALNGRAYMIDMKSGQMAREFEARLRDSSDDSTAPGEAAINPQGLWRRGEVSWHLGAGQKYADTADSQPYRFYKSKGVNPWTKGELTLLNATKVALASTGSTQNLRLLTTDVAVFVTDGTALKYTTDPYASSPTWTTVSGLPAASPRGLCTDGANVYLTYAGTSNSYGIWKVNSSYVASNLAYGLEFYDIDYAKGHLFATTSGGGVIYNPSGNETATDDSITLSGWEWQKIAPGQNAVYLAGHTGSRSVVFKVTIKTDGTFDKLVAALELPNGEIIETIHGYLGFVLIGSNKGWRFCSTDSNSNLVAGPLVRTPGTVYDFTSNNGYVWFGYSNYDGESSGIGRINLAYFNDLNQPSYATDLMYDNTGDVLSVDHFNDKLIYTIKGVGVVVEDSANLVASGTLETGTYRWDIPDRKFLAKVDIRTVPLVGSVTPYVAYDNGSWVELVGHTKSLATESTVSTPQSKFIEAKFKIELTRATATTGPTLTRWMGRAYATPARSQVFDVPLLIAEVVNVRGADYFFNIEDELLALRNLVTNPRIVNYQENSDVYSVIVENVRFVAVDRTERNNKFQGTAIVSMRTVQD